MPRKPFHLSQQTGGSREGPSSPEPSNSGPDGPDRETQIRQARLSLAHVSYERWLADEHWRYLHERDEVGVRDPRV